MTLTLSTFARECGNVPEPLVRAVVRQFGGWQSFKEAAHDVANHGIDSGFHGFIYTAETVKFARRNRATIAQLADSMADDFGETAIDMISKFACLRNQNYPARAVARALYGSQPRKGDDEDDIATVRNALAWFAGEEVARAYSDRVSE